jgi:hypothetical protein
VTKMAPDLSATPQAKMHLSGDGAVDGWCFYPDRPEERALVELVANGRVIGTMLATRLCVDRRDLGMGDGHYGFSFPFSPPGTDDERVIVEVREKRFATVIGRLILGGDDPARTRRLEAIFSSLSAVDQVLSPLRADSTISDSMKTLGRTLIYLAGRPKDKRSLRLPGLQAGLADILEIPAMDLGWHPEPRFSIVIPAEVDTAALANSIRTVAHALKGVGAEYFLIDNGEQGFATLLPTRLRGLNLIRVASSASLGAAFNAAAAAARGKFLIFARRGGPRPADLQNALDCVKSGEVGIDTDLAPEERTNTAGLVRHALQCTVSREDFAALGGFESLPSEAQAWRFFVAKARALGLKIAPWMSPRRTRWVA